MSARRNRQGGSSLNRRVSSQRSASIRHMARNFGKAVAVVALIAGGIYAYMRWSSPDSTPGQSTRHKPDRIAEIAPASAAAAQDDEMSAGPVIATVYECAGAEGRVLSDKPCASDARVRQVREPNRMDQTTVERPASNSQPQGALIFKVVVPVIKTCADVHTGITNLSRHLREDENLPKEIDEMYRQRLRELVQTKKDMDCR